MGFFANLFGIKKNDPKKTSPSAKFLNGAPSEPAYYSGDLYTNGLVGSIVHRIASYASMLSFEHVRGDSKNFEIVDDEVHKLLAVKPNFYMTPSDVQYKSWTDLLLRNNSYQYILRDKQGKPIALLPVIAGSIEMQEIDGFLFYKFTFSSGQSLIVYQGDVVHNRLFFYRNDIFGSENIGLREDVGFNNSMRTSLQAAMENGAYIRGILKHANTIDPEDLEAQEKIFKESYLKPGNNGGIGVIDAKFDIIPLNYTGKFVDKDQMAEIRDCVYRHFGVNDKILLSTYTSDEWQSYFEGNMSPILNQMIQRYNLAFFTDKELGYKNRIQSSVNQVSFMSSAQKIQMVKLALDGALYNRNDIRAWFGDSPIPGGDTYQYSKNFTENTNTGGNESGTSDETDSSNTNTEE